MFFFSLLMISRDFFKGAFMRGVGVTLCVIASIAVGGCRREAINPPPIMAVSVMQSDGSLAGPHGGRSEEGSAIELRRVQLNVPRGSEIGHISKPMLYRCEGASWGRLTYDGGRFTSQSPEWRDIFFTVMSGHGFRSAGNPEQLFSEEDETEAEAEYLVGANVNAIHIKADLQCDGFDPNFVGLAGYSNVTIDWQVFDPVSRRIVYRRKIDGEYRTTQIMPNDPYLLIQFAFADSANKLAADQRLREIVTRNLQRPAAADAKITSRHLLSRQPQLSGTIDRHIDTLRSATVLIEAGENSHGSGFIISEDGYALTNQHVVAGQTQVRVKLLSGRSVVGTVVRRHTRRDVALIKLEGGGYPVMTVRETPVSIAEDVYAIGAPQMKALAWTVTRGVISAYRPAPSPDRVDYIQADVPIHGGNSGGPLLDRYGNLVGISVAGYGMDERKRNASLNLFIPILDGLEKLGVDLVDPATYERARRTAAAD